MYLRLRQICLVAKDLAKVEGELGRVLGLEPCFRDPGVGQYGLHNVLFAAGGTFLEVVSPMREGTAGGRYIERRKGDGGYMFILDCDDLEARRENIAEHHAKLVADVSRSEHGAKSEAIHLHPRDTGGCLLSIDRHSGGKNLQGGYVWAGPDWQTHDRSKTVAHISGADMQCDNPQKTAERWSELLERPVVRKSGWTWEMKLDLGKARFVPLGDDRGEGLSAVHLAVKDKAAILKAAKKEKVPFGEDWTDLCGVRFQLETG
jgi:hypothetical protein